MEFLRVVIAMVVTCGFLPLHGVAEVVPCTVTQDGPLTTYNILHDFTAFLSDSSDSEYSYSDGNNTVLAIQENSTDPVKNHSINRLVSSRCIPTVNFISTSFSKGEIKAEYSATCSINCSVGTPSAVTDPDPWIALKVGIPVLVLVLAGLCVLCYKFKDGIRRMCCCSQVGGYYVGVKMTNNGAQVVEV